MARSVFKTAEVFARGLVGSIPTLSRRIGSKRFASKAYGALFSFQLGSPNRSLAADDESGDKMHLFLSGPRQTLSAPCAAHHVHQEGSGCCIAASQLLKYGEGFAIRETSSTKLPLMPSHLRSEMGSKSRPNSLKSKFPFEELHGQHAATRLSHVLVPPRVAGTT